MSTFLELDESAALSFVAGVIFMLVAALEILTSGDWLVMMLNGLIGFLLFVDGGRQLLAADQNSRSA